MARETDMTGTTLSSAAAPPQTVPPVAANSLAQDERVPGQSVPSDSNSAGKKSRQHDDARVPAFLISTIFHTLLLVLLALFTYQGSVAKVVGLKARQGDPTPTVSFQLIDQTDDRHVADGATAERPITVSIAPAQPLALPSPLEADRSIESDASIDADLNSGGASAKKTPLIRLPGGGLSGRTPEGRAKYGRIYGATSKSEEAVDAALAWLAEHQRPNGSWSFNLDLDPCNGRCSHSKKGGDTPTPSTGATGLALLAFLGAGHTHHNDGPYRETVRRGIYYLRDIAAQTEAGYDWQQGSMYGHGIALMALGEALSMSSEPGNRRGSDLYPLVKRGASFSCVAQHSSGSWGYVPGSPGDTTVSGWQVLSLIAAKRSNIELHTNSLPRAKSFVMSTCTDRDYWFGYKGPPGEPTTTAIGLTLLLYLGESPEYTPFYNALTKMAERGPTLNNIYHDYYATLALHHCRHPDWDQWNTELREHLIATQSKSGHEAGSWHFRDRWGDVGGRLYTTAMCAMTLEVYYRYLPLYEAIDEFPL